MKKILNTFKKIVVFFIIYLIFDILLMYVLPEKIKNKWEFSKQQEVYPCFCLCFLILQETRTMPLRLYTLQALHIFFTDDRTFIVFTRYFFFEFLDLNVTLPRVRS